MSASNRTVGGSCVRAPPVVADDEAVREVGDREYVTVMPVVKRSTSSAIFWSMSSSSSGVTRAEVVPFLAERVQRDALGVVLSAGVGLGGVRVHRVPLDRQVGRRREGEVRAGRVCLLGVVRLVALLVSNDPETK